MTEVGTVRRIKRGKKGNKGKRYIYAFNREIFKYTYIKYSTAGLYDEKYITNPDLVKGYERQIYTNKARALRKNILNVIETRTSNNYDVTGLLDEVKDKLYSMTDEEIHNFAQNYNNMLREYFKYEQLIKYNNVTHTQVNRAVGSTDMDASTQVVLDALGINMEKYYTREFRSESAKKAHENRMNHLKNNFLKKIDLNNEE